MSSMPHSQTNHTEKIQAALQFHRANRLDEAEKIYREILSQSPRHAAVLHMLGELCFRRGDLSQADKLISQAIEIMPDNADFYHDLGLVKKQQGNIKVAIDCYQNAVSREPKKLISLLNLGLLLQEQDNVQEAIDCFQQILHHQPNEIRALHCLGLAHQQMGETDRAVEFFQKALLINPNHVTVLENLGLALSSQKQFVEAEQCLQKAIKAEPKRGNTYYSMASVLFEQGKEEQALEYGRQAIKMTPDALTYNNVGYLLHQLGKHQDALQALQESIRLNPNQVEPLNNLGLVLTTLCRFDEALAFFDKAIALDPHHAQTYNSKGLALADLGRKDEALAAYDTALQYHPNFVEALINKSTLLLKDGKTSQAMTCLDRALALKPDMGDAYNNRGTVLQNQGYIDEALKSYQKALELIPANANTHSNLVFCQNYDATLSQEELYREATKWWQAHGTGYEPMVPTSLSVQAGRRLRIGYVSPDFRYHPVSSFFLPLLENHNHDQFEVFCYGEVPNPDQVTKRIEDRADHYCNTVSLSDMELAERIVSDRIDILVDLAGHTANNRLKVFARQPAPIQATWLGYANTTGLPTIAYRFTDQLADPPGSGEFYSEKLLRLPGCFLCFQPEIDAPPVSPLPALQKGSITFGSFNNPSKVNESVIEVWAKILKAVPQAHLLLKGKQFADDKTCAIYCERFAKHGITRERLTLLGRLPRLSDHLAIYNQVDIGLDPFPYNGTTTTFEALWMGVPVITLRGDRHAGRVGATILSNAGIAELITDNIDDYIAKAVELAENQERLAQYRESMRAKLSKSSLLDGKAFAAKMEQSYLTMAGRAQQADTHSPPPHAQETSLDEQSSPAGPPLSAPSVAAALNSHGETLFGIGNVERAAFFFTEALQLNPQFAEAYNNLGVLAFRQENLSHALHCFRQALDINNDDQVALANITDVLQAMQHRASEPAAKKTVRPRTLEQILAGDPDRFRIVPLGSDCTIPHRLRAKNLRHEALPFDWNVIPIQSVLALFANDFEDFLKKENLVFLPPTPRLLFKEDGVHMEMTNDIVTPVICRKYNMLFPHDFPAAAEEAFEQVVEKYRRRIKRLYDLFASGREIIFVAHNGRLNEWQQRQFALSPDVTWRNDFIGWAKKLAAILSPRYPQAPFHFYEGQTLLQLLTSPTLVGQAANRAGSVPSTPQAPGHNKIEQSPSESPADQQCCPLDIQQELGRATAMINEGRLQEAENICRAILQHTPAQPDALNLWATIALKVGNNQAALEFLQQAHQPEIPRANILGNMGIALQGLQRLDEAINAYSQAIALNPSVPSFYYNMGNAHQEKGNPLAAEDCYQKAIQLNPAYFQGYNNLGVIYQEQGKTREAKEYFLKALQHNDRIAGAHKNLGEIYASEGELDQAQSCFAKALEIQPGFPDAIAGQARILEKKRQYDAALSLLEPLLQKPETASSTAASLFARLSSRLTKEREAIALISSMLSSQQLNPGARLQLYFSLGMLHDKLGEYDEAFSAYRQGNELKQLQFDASDNLNKVRETIEVFRENNLAQAKNSSRLPIFIVGMPRSGTSLTEQILASHPGVYGAGELADITLLHDSMPEVLKTSLAVPHCLKQATTAILDQLAEEHLDKLAAMAGDPAICRVTDKMPANFWYVGFIRMLFPQAAIIHCRRDPVDTCLSCYFQDFSGRHTYAYDLASLGQFYRHYEALMTFWRDEMRIPMLEIQYETLINNQEEESRRLIEFCGLDWHPACLDFHQSKRIVHTASTQQVRQPIYKSSMGRWKNYEKHLEPLLNALGMKA